jgi:hypothetical protein
MRQKPAFCLHFTAVLPLFTGTFNVFLRKMRKPPRRAVLKPLLAKGFSRYCI